MNPELPADTVARCEKGFEHRTVLLALVCDEENGRQHAQDSGVARARPEGAVEAERRQDQAEPCNSAPPTTELNDGPGGDDGQS